MKLPSFSIVINTLNRGPALQKTLESFQWLKYDGEFEVVVVNGPSTDTSPEVIKSWLPRIRAGTCPVANLSVSRNIGICMAQGEIVAFIDDDAIPEPEWLSQLAQAYADPIVGAVGGLVFDHTGYDFQYRYVIVDRFGNAQPVAGPTPALSFPKSLRFPHLLGCNSSFRRSALLEVGGFDEEYEYFLDETDVCLRIVDAGYLIAQMPNAYVHHKFAPSNIRGENKVTKYRFPIIKNKIYFMLKNSREFFSLEQVFKEQQVFINQQKADVDWCYRNKLLSDLDVETFNQDLVRAIDVGLKRGFEGVTADGLITPAKQERYAGEFLPFAPIPNEDFKVRVLVTRDFPPNHGGGIATFNKDLAQALAAKGHIVHVITQSPDHNRVDFEEGVWVHRLVPKSFELSAKAKQHSIPQNIWDWSSTALQEAQRIATHRDIDSVEAPIWDCEGCAFYFDGQWPLVVSLQTTLHFWLDTHPERRADKAWMQRFGEPMLALEGDLMKNAHAIRSISQAIAHDIESAYGFKFDPKRLLVAPLGLPDPALSEESSSQEALPEETLSEEKRRLADLRDGAVEILFVGRLELRKGIDVLLEIAGDLLMAAPNARLRIVGDDTISGPDGKPFKTVFLKKNAGQAWLDRVIFTGRVDDQDLLLAYQRCDVFVAPSRFESFGLIFVEAMRASKPVIGCSVGGMPEIIEDTVNGFLVPPSDAQALKDAILRLVNDPAQRTKMGEAGRRIFLEKFTAQRMADVSEVLYARAAECFTGQQAQVRVGSSAGSALAAAPEAGTTVVSKVSDTKVSDTTVDKAAP